MMMVLALVSLWVTARALATELFRRRLVLEGKPMSLPDDVVPVHPRTGRRLSVFVAVGTDDPLATVGFFRPVIVMHAALPDWLTSAELRCALAHEAAHIARCDGLRCLIVPPILASLILLLAGAAFPAGEETFAWFSTAVTAAIALAGGWAMQVMLARRAELACDRNAARHGRFETASAIVKASRLTSHRLADHGSVALADRHIAKRVQALLRDPGHR